MFAAKSIAYMWPITRSQIYGELPRLEELGLIAGEDVAQEKLPDKRVYALTGKGRAALQDWYDDDIIEERFHSSLLAKLFFAEFAQGPDIEQILDQCDARATSAQAHYQDLVDHLSQKDYAFYPRLTALYALRQAQSTKGWVTEARELLDTRPTTGRGPN
jgi:DNA-binding PadR family transcriptional regulator